MTTTRPSTCHDCPARDEGIGYAGPTGPEDAPILLLGQGPGAQEIYYGTAFYHHAPSGLRLGDWLNAAGISRKNCYVDNIVRCRFIKRGSTGEPKMSPRTRDYMDREPTAKEIEACLTRHLIPQLRRILVLPRPQGRLIVIPVGKPAATALIGPRSHPGSLTMLHSALLSQRLGNGLTILNKKCETLPAQ